MPLECHCQCGTGKSVVVRQKSRAISAAIARANVLVSVCFLRKVGDLQETKRFSDAVLLDALLGRSSSLERS